MIHPAPSHMTRPSVRRRQRGRAPAHQTSLPSIRVVLAAIAATITFLAAYIYPVGLLTLAREIQLTYRLSFAAAWYAATLAPLPVVAFQSLRILIAYSFEYLAIVTLLTYGLSYYIVSFVAQFTKASRPANPLLQRIERWMGAHHWGVASGILAALIIGYAVRGIGAPWWIVFAGAGGLRLGVLVDRRQAFTRRVAEALQRAILTLAGPVGKTKGAIAKLAKRPGRWDAIASTSTIGAGAVLALAAAIQYGANVAYARMASRTQPASSIAYKLCAA